MALWLMIGKSRVAALILQIYQIIVIVLRFINNRFTPASLVFSILVLGIYLPDVLGTFEFRKNYQNYLFASNKPY